ncbi:MAG: F0F1 ATP synthase subunit B [Faecalibacterium prausnitzii]
MDHAGWLDLSGPDLQPDDPAGHLQKVPAESGQKVIAERKAKADSQIADAEKLRTEAEAMKAEYEQNLQNARTEANQIVAAAQKTAAARSEELLGEARAQAAALKQKAEADIAQERKKAVNEVKDEIGGMAMEIASKVVEREIKEADHQDLIDEFIKNVGEAS